MFQTQYADREVVDAQAIGYIDELVAVGELPPSAKVNRCVECASIGLIRPAIFGEDYCVRCWNGQWKEEKEFPVYVGSDGQEHGEYL